MRITLVIDSLTSGGAQRQIVLLARLLAQRGYGVAVVVYYGYQFFRPALEDAEIPVSQVPWRGKFDRLRQLRKAINTTNPDAVIAFMKTPSLLTELCALTEPSWHLIVSERNTTQGKISAFELLRYGFHARAAAVVCNSESQAARIWRAAPWLRGQLYVIRNCVDTEAFCPSDVPRSDRQRRVLVSIGRYVPAKNIHGYIEAIARVVELAGACNFSVRWYGNQKILPDYVRALKLRAKALGLDGSFEFHGERRDVVNVYHEADAVVLPSFYEGCPNIICEAMACGLPVVCSRVCDNEHLLAEGKAGFLFDPWSTEDMAYVINRVLSMPHEELHALGAVGRRVAEKLFSPGRLLRDYESLVRRRRNELDRLRWAPK